MDHAPIKVLVVEDTSTVRALLVHAIESDPRLQVAGAVSSGEQALEFLIKVKPDVILMDIHLPGMNGFEATRCIMQSRPIPIVICSAVADPTDVATTFEAIQAGALAVLAKPVGHHHPLYQSAVKHLVDTLTLMSEVKVIRRWPRPGPKPQAAKAAALLVPTPQRTHKTAQIVAIGTSTGGPPVLRTILSDLSLNFPVPIVVVQHIARGFLPGLVEWLAETCALPIHIAARGERPFAAHVYFAPDDFQLGFGPQGQFVLSDRMQEDTLCPSVSHLFKSVAQVYGSAAIGVLLTGMGKDGAPELALLKRSGAITIAEDKSSSVVHGMPGEAIRLGGATYVLPANEVAGALKRILNQS